MGWIARLLGRDPEPIKRDATDSDPSMWMDSLYSVRSVSGINVNQGTALNAAAVMAAVTMLAEDVAKLPWSLRKKNDDGSSDEETSHPLADLLHEPNDWQNGLEFREQMQIGLVLRGNAYAVILYDGRGRPTMLVPVNPDWVSLWQAPGGDLFYRVTPQGLHMMAVLQGQPFLIPASDMLHLRGFSSNGLVGASRIALARESIGLALAQEQQAARFIANAARPSGMLTTDQKLTPEAAQRLAADFKAASVGLQNTGKVIVGEQGLKYAPLSPAASDLEFLASRKFQIEEIARIFRIPLHMLANLERSTNNNIMQQSQEYVNYTLTGYTNRWCAKLSSHFGLRKAGLFVEFDFNELTKADLTTRINNWRTQIMSMMATPDEARIDLGFKPKGKQADTLQFPQNMAAAGSQSTGTKPDNLRPTPGGPEKPEPAEKAYNPDQPRDEIGRWGSGSVHDTGVQAHGPKTAKKVQRQWQKDSPYTDAEKIHARAVHDQVTLAEAAAEIGKENGVEFKNPGPKKLEDLENKITVRGKKATGITDGVRGGYNVTTPEQADSIVAGLGKRFPTIDEGWATTDAGYFDRKALVKFPDGIVGEVQFWHPAMEDAKKHGGGHRLYKIARDLKDGDPEKARLESEMRDIYGKVTSNLPSSWDAALKHHR
ncbi:MAG: phage portal protein [Rhodoplanes sp.]|uniref:phage portal protein n=1 Tax=Rhodoplanes sp. TaxID=1968906 RepID=UPI0017B7A7DB|nr:phage portal protein [Rhodoplanes sp.]NVO13887.1 phage portal protein [Rhodoplanes sp.]